MAGTAEINKPEKGRKKRRLWLKILGGIIGVLVLFIGITFIVNVISNGIEEEDRIVRAIRQCRREKDECADSRQR